MDLKRVLEPLLVNPKKGWLGGYVAGSHPLPPHELSALLHAFEAEYRAEIKLPALV